MTAHLLQELLLPGLEFGAVDDLYVRANAEARLDLAARRIDFQPGGIAWFDTFFNGLTVGTWRRHCSLDTLALELSGEGRFALRFGLHRHCHAHRWLSDVTIELKPGEPLSVPVEAWPGLETGMLYLMLRAIGPGRLTGGRFVTRTPPRNKVRLGIVITHFNRKPQVLPAIARINAGLLQSPEHAGTVSLIVVDNSSNIAPQEAPGAIVIGNRNLGGAGGFMRGLLYLRDTPGFTHCLFMDDDASCEIASITRTIALLQYAHTEKFAVAGSLLREIEPFRLFEKGARFDGVCHPLKSGLDMRHVGDLMAAELPDRLPHYGGWWFFAFALADVKHYAFPFFVRGDDLQFALLHEFNLCTMNGIGCWAEDFGLKNGPLPVYLDLRSHLVHQIAVLGTGSAGICRIAARFFLFAALTYNYASARAITLAVQDVTKGPDFWRENLDMSARRAEIADFAAAEKMRPIDRTDYDLRFRSNQETRRRKFFRVLTLNGFLLPSFLLRDEIVFQHKSFNGALRVVFRYRRVLYEYEPSSLGYVAAHDKRAFFSALLGFCGALARFAWALPGLRGRYRAALPELTSEAFWRGVYAEQQAPRKLPEIKEIKPARPAANGAFAEQNKPADLAFLPRRLRRTGLGTRRD